jgi:sec-independent protein translocase protein TatC
MSKRPDDDLFAETTMTFGEHLEELRGTLYRALIGLVAGFLVGLLVANYVVDFIQTPLRQALIRYYAKAAKFELEGMYDKELPEPMEKFLKQHQVTFEEVILERRELKRIAQQLAADDSQTSVLDLNEPLPPPDADVLQTGIRMRVWRPLTTKITTLSAQEAFMIWLKAAFVTGLAIASPYIFWQVWQFIAAGLYPHERRYVHIYLPFSLVLFWAGVAMAFFLVFRYVLDFLLGFNLRVNIEAEPRISEWMSFVLFLPLGFGIAFQLPLVMLFLHRITIFSVEAYIQKWRIAVLVIFVISMLLTPADPISMLLMAAPLSALYFLGIALCKWMPKIRSPYSDAYEP